MHERNPWKLVVIEGVEDGKYPPEAEADRRQRRERASVSTVRFLSSAKNPTNSLF